MEKSDAGYCFPVMRIQNQRYKVFGIVTNMDWAGDMLIPWRYQRCGKSEEAHAAMKTDFAGDKFPSGDFGENAAWWLIMVLSHNLNVLMKRLVLGDSWIPKRFTYFDGGLWTLYCLDRGVRLQVNCPIKFMR